MPLLGPLAAAAVGWLRRPRLGKQLRRIRRQTEELRAELQGSAASLARVEAEIAALRHDSLQAGRRLEHRLDGMLQHLVVIQRSVAARPDGPSVMRPPESAAPNPVAGAADAFYAAFEDCFRGTRAEIRERQAAHLPWLQRQDARLGSLPVVDLGCGRGEWLELLRDHAITAIGVDLNQVFLAENAKRGLEVVAADALSYLGGRSDGSVRAVTGFHIIEHLPFTVLQALLDECARVLAEGGLVLFETPNPENLITAARNFYYDPTHRNPIPPEAAAFLLRAHGFAEVQILRLHENLDPIRHEVQSEFLQQLLFGPQDYAVVGWWR